MACMRFLKKVDAEPTGFAFNSLLNMEIKQRKDPMNPFVNQGAIVVNSLVRARIVTNALVGFLIL